jgi:hypothetical protein
MKTKVLNHKDLNKSNNELIAEIENFQNAENSKCTDIINEYNENPILIEEKAENPFIFENERLKREIEDLKSNNQRPLFFDYEQAAEIIAKKKACIDEISKLQSAKIKLSNIDLNSRNRNNNFDSDYYSLGLIYGSRDEFIFKLSNVETIKEFIEFVHIRIDLKIEALKAEVQNL